MRSPEEQEEVESAASAKAGASTLRMNQDSSTGSHTYLVFLAIFMVMKLTPKGPLGMKYVFSQRDQLWQFVVLVQVTQLRK